MKIKKGVQDLLHDLLDAHPCSNIEVIGEDGVVQYITAIHNTMSDIKIMISPVIGCSNYYDYKELT